MAYYSALDGMLTKPQLFRACIAPFMIYFLAFGLYIYPNRESLHPTTSADSLATILPGGLVAIYRFWSYSLFYILAELWGTVVLSVLFWGLANDCTPVTTPHTTKHTPLSLHDSQQRAHAWMRALTDSCERAGNGSQADLRAVGGWR